MTGQFESLLLWFFVGAALLGGVLMLLVRHPMRAALALVGVMLSLAGVYAVIGVHAVAVFQVLIYVGAVMVFMVYVVMLLDVRDPSFTRRYSRFLVPGIGGALVFLAACAGLLGTGFSGEVAPTGKMFEIQPFSKAFLSSHWLEFELASVLLLVAVVAVLAVIKGGSKDHD
jgi:NADH-quinone oxidoreductase subunit J